MTVVDNGIALEVPVPDSMLATPGTVYIKVADSHTGRGDYPAPLPIIDLALGHVALSPNAATFTIAPPIGYNILMFSSATFRANVATHAATVTVSRVGALGAPVTVHSATSDGTVKAGFNYAATSGTLTFAGGQASKTFTVPLKDASGPVGVQTINLTLSNPTGGADIGAPSTAVLTIQAAPKFTTAGQATFKVGESRLLQGGRFGIAGTDVQHLGGLARRHPPSRTAC